MTVKATGREAQWGLTPWNRFDLSFAVLQFCLLLPGLAGEGRCEGTLGEGGPQADLLFWGIQVLRSRLKELQHLITLRDVGGQLDQGLEKRTGE